MASGAQSFVLFALAAIFASGCSSKTPAPSAGAAPEPAAVSAPASDSAFDSGGAAAPAPAPAPPSSATVANVKSVEVSGKAGAYRFAVRLASPDTGCDQYANWWEVVRDDGTLAYRRILGHSHVSEQPFVRSGGPVPIFANETVIVRAHMHPSGYGGVSLRGTVAKGFKPEPPAPKFAADLETAEPQPNGCAF